MIGSLEMGGSQAFVMNLYRHIDKSKIQFDFIVDTPGKNCFENEITAFGGKVYSMPKFNGLNFHRIKKTWNDFLTEHKEYKILHSHVRSYASIYLPIAKKHGLKTIIHSHSTSNGSGISSFGKSILQYPLRFIADYFFGCSKEAGIWLFGKKIVKSKRYRTVTNAIDVSAYFPNEYKRIEMKKSLGLQNEVILGNVGRLHEAKNQTFLIEIFDAYHRNNGNSKLVIVGEGELREKLENLIKEKSLESSVVLTGARSDIADVMQTFDYFVFPSKWEGLPVSVVEAQSAGLQCFVSDAVTKEVALTPLVHHLPINNGTEVWTGAFENTSFERKDYSESIEKAGFNVRTLAVDMADFYENISREL